MASLGRLLLVVINLILMIISLVMIVGGFIVKYGTELLKEHYSGEIDKIKSKVSGVFGSANADAISASNLDVNMVMGILGTILIVFGFFILAISFFGLFGACCKIRKFLAIYAVIVTVLLVGQIVFISLVYDGNDTIKQRMAAQMNDLLKDYQGLNGTNAQSLVWNLLMTQYKCCGVTNYEDFKSGTQWWGASTHVTPLACCTTLPTTQSEATVCAGSAGQTTANLNTAKNNYNTGCLDELWEHTVIEYKLYIVFGVTALCLFQFFMIVCAMFLYCQDDNNSKVKPVSKPHKHRSNNSGRGLDW